MNHPRVRDVPKYSQRATGCSQAADQPVASKLTPKNRFPEMSEAAEKSGTGEVDGIANGLVISITTDHRMGTE